MIAFISPTASPLLKQVLETLLLQEEVFTEEDKAKYSFAKRAVNAVLHTYHANKITVLKLGFVAVENGYSLSVNGESVSFLHEPTFQSVTIKTQLK